MNDQSHGTVTIFGDHDAVDRALGEEFGRRGWSTHSVTVPTGWLRSAPIAIVRPNSHSGASALKQLATAPSQPPARVVALCPEPVDPLMAERLDVLCRQGGSRHNVTLIWHPRVPSDDPGGETSLIRPSELASVVADEVARGTGSPPHFEARSLQPQ